MLQDSHCGSAKIVVVKSGERGLEAGEGGAPSALSVVVMPGSPDPFVLSLASPLSTFLLARTYPKIFHGLTKLPPSI